jgi:hypothetical protein
MPGSGRRRAEALREFQGLVDYEPAARARFQVEKRRELVGTTRGLLWGGRLVGTALLGAGVVLAAQPGSDAPAVGGLVGFGGLGLLALTKLLGVSENLAERLAVARGAVARAMNVPLAQRRRWAQARVIDRP